MKPHFSMVISANSRMEFQTELFIRSLERYGNCSDYFLDIFVLEGEKINNRYIKRKANIIAYQPVEGFSYAWIGSQPRWCEPKSEICFHIDADVLVASDFKEIIDYCSKPGFYACIANDPPFELSKWREVYDYFGLSFPEKMYFYKRACGDFQGDKEKVLCPFYPNFGFIAVHSAYVNSIRNKLIEVLFELNSKCGNNYYIPQIAITITLQALNIPTYLMPNRFNYMPEYKYDEELVGSHNPIIYHYKHEYRKIEDFKKQKELYNFVKQILQVKLC